MIEVTIAGNLGANSEIKNNGGRDYLTFRVGAQSGYGDNKTTVWFGCSYHSTNVQQYLQKGTKIVCIGTLKIEENNGTTYYNVRCSNVKFWNDAPRRYAEGETLIVNTQETKNENNQNLDDEIPF